MEKKSQKHYYWIKLWEWFMHSDQMKLILRQRNGPLYIVLFLYLCIDTANYNGFFEKKIGDYSIDLDAREIYSGYLPYFQNCEGYSFDSVQLALEIYKQLRLTYYEGDKLRVSNYDKLIGSESASAERMRRLRDKNKQLQASQCDGKMSQCDPDVTSHRKEEKKEKNQKKKEEEKEVRELEVRGKIEEEEGACVRVNENDILREQLVFGVPLFISNNQKIDLFKKLTEDELKNYTQRVLGLMAENYTFMCSHYKFILSIRDKERKVKDG